MNHSRIMTVGAMVLGLLIAFLWAGVTHRSGPRHAALSDASDPIDDTKQRPTTGSMAQRKLIMTTPSGRSDLNDVFSRIEKLEAKIEALNQQHQELKIEQHNLARRQDGLQERFEPPVAASEDPHIDEADDAPVVSEEKFVQERLTLLDTELSSQGIDRAWAPKAAEKISRVFDNDALKGTLLLEVACAATLCRLELAHEDEDSMTRFMDEFPPILHWKTNSFHHHVVDHDGSHISQLYLSKEGFALP